MAVGVRREVMKNLAGRAVGELERTSLLGGQETLHVFCDGEFRSTVISVSFYAKGGVHQLTMVCTQQQDEREFRKDNASISGV